MLKNITKIIIVGFICLLSANTSLLAQNIVVFSEITNMTGTAILTGQDGDCERSLDKFKVQIDGTVSFASSNVSYAGYSVKIYFNEGSDCIVDAGSDFLNAGVFSNSEGPIDKELIIDVDDFPYLSCRGRLAGETIITISPLTLSSNPSFHTIAGDKKICSGIGSIIID